MARPPRPKPDALTMPAGRRIPRTPSTRPDLPSPPPEARDEPGASDAGLRKAGAELASLVGTIRACRACGRASGRRVFGSGYPRAPVLLVKDRPGPEDIRAETAFAGEAEALERAFDRLGIPRTWAYGSTSVRCGTSAARPDEIRACSEHLLVEVEAVEPKVIVAFGEPALDAVRALDGRCGIAVPESVERGRPVPLRPGTVLLVTEPLPEGVTAADAKRRLWRDLQALPALLT